jgi:hypothetical protein
MLLSEARSTVLSALRPDSSTYSNTDVDRAIRAAGSRFARDTRCCQATGTVTLTANSPEVSISSITYLRPERAIWFEIGHSDQGTWATSTAYSKNDLVQGDGDPDSKFYVCTTGHTSSASNEPPNADNWSEVNWKRGWEVRVIGYSDLAQIKRDQESYGFSRSGAFESGFPSDSADRPRVIGFLNATTAYLHPTPDIAYPLVIQYWQPFTTWTLGTTDATTLNIPDEYVEPVMWYGASALLEFPDPKGRSGSVRWSNYLDAIAKAKGLASPNTGVKRKNVAAYL